MPIKRYTSEADSTITDGYKPNLITRATASNMGASDSLEIYSLYGQASSSSLERSRILVKFPLDGIVNDRAASKLPVSGGVNFFLRLFNVKHPFTLPREYYLQVNAISQSWNEGYGLDMESYSDNGFGVTNGYGVNWIYAQSGTLWSTTGSSVTGNFSYTQFFKDGYEDLEVDVTPLVESWISGVLPNNGFLIKLSGSQEDGSTATSFYTKKFSARGTEFFYSRPVIEARWDASSGDDRENFYISSSLLSSVDNTQNLSFFNRVKGVLKNIPGNPSLGIKFYTDSTFLNEISGVVSSVSNTETGIYKASVILATTASTIYDRWYNLASTSSYFYSGSIEPKTYEASLMAFDSEYFINLVNVKTKYTKDENVFIRLYSREKDWSPTIYTVSSKDIENKPIKNLYFKIFRLEDKLEIIPYSTGSIPYTKLSYDSQGNYFKFDMSILEPDYAYGIKFATYDGNELKEYKETFKFRVE
jgi:hypothetical protein